MHRKRVYKGDYRGVAVYYYTHREKGKRLPDVVFQINGSIAIGFWRAPVELIESNLLIAADALCVWRVKKKK